MAPLRHGLDIKATVFTWSITTDIRANLLSARFSERAPAATRILFSACCRDHDDTRVLARRGREFGSALAERVAKTKLALGISAPCGGSGKRPSPAGVEGPRFA